MKRSRGKDEEGVFNDGSPEKKQSMPKPITPLAALHVEKDELRTTFREHGPERKQILDNPEKCIAPLRPATTSEGPLLPPPIGHGGQNREDAEKTETMAEEKKLAEEKRKPHDVGTGKSHERSKVQEEKGCPLESPATSDQNPGLAEANCSHEKKSIAPETPDKKNENKPGPSAYKGNPGPGKKESRAEAEPDAIFPVEEENENAFRGRGLRRRKYLCRR
jgi:hypothetical protein